MNDIELGWFATSDLVNRFIEKIAKEPSRTGKIALLEEAKNSGNQLFPWVMKKVFDNTVNFGIVLRPEEYEDKIAKAVKNEQQFTFEIYNFIRMLADGNYTRRQAVAEFNYHTLNMSPDSIRLLVKIINKNVNAGINSSTVNKVFKGLIPTFPYMRCSLPSKVDIGTMEWEAGVYIQEKADGMFANINISNDSILLLSRQGSEIPTEAFKHEAEILKAILPNNCQVHGEMLIRNPTGSICPRETGNGIINAICKGGSLPRDHSVLFRVWDCIPLNAVASKGRYTTPYKKRFEELKRTINVNSYVFFHDSLRTQRIPIEVIETAVVHSIDEAKVFYRRMLSLGKEGAVIKNPSAIWRDGTSKEQIKLKLECDCDLLVIGFEEGEGKFRGSLGSLVCRSADGLLMTNVSGFSDKTRRDIWSDKEGYLDSIVTVRFNDVMRKGDQTASLFLPRFVEFRTDKTEADTLERIIASQKQATDL